ncbi:hypothetical protein T492DRAFT_1016807, partial [Pavlovales sp. CCMP2436]
MPSVPRLALLLLAGTVGVQSFSLHPPVRTSLLAVRLATARSSPKSGGRALDVRARVRASATDAAGAGRRGGGGLLLSVLRLGVRSSLTVAVLAARFAGLTLGLWWAWLPVALYWALPVVEKAAATGNTPLAIAMMGGEALEQLVDMACTSVFLPVVGILYAILIGLTIDALWSQQRDLRSSFTVDCARSALLLPSLLRALAGSPLKAAALRLLRGHMLGLASMVDPAPSLAKRSRVAEGGAKASMLDLVRSDLAQLTAMLSEISPSALPAGGDAEALAFAAAESRELLVSSCERSSMLRVHPPPVVGGCNVLRHENCRRSRNSVQRTVSCSRERHSLSAAAACGGCAGRRKTRRAV